VASLSRLTAKEARCLSGAVYAGRWFALSSTEHNAKQKAIWATNSSACIAEGIGFLGIPKRDIAALGASTWPPAAGLFLPAKHAEKTLTAVLRR
jgi:hypothetical protein